MQFRPSRIDGAWLRFVLPAEDAESIAGDLEEGFHTIAAERGRRAARRWHRRQVASVTMAWMFRRAGDGETQPGRQPMEALRHDLGHALGSVR